MPTRLLCAAMKIQIVTINTWKCDGDYYKRMQVLANQLKKLTPHIVACQECFLSVDEKIDTLRFLAEELDMYYHFTPARLKERMLNGQLINGYSGLGVLSAFRLDVVNEFDLPTVDADGERKVLQTALQITDENKLMFTNIHLTHLKNAADLRKRQIQLIAQKTPSTGYAYSLLCGDFNTTIESEEIELLKNLTNASDCYAAGGGAIPAISVNHRSGEGIDHIFSIPAEQADVVFTRSAVVLNQADSISGIYPSDHFGISTTLITN